ncbi:hypothetical protein GCM10023331_33150 [Algivirga pacifica]|uniref:Peptidase S54 rhomboid domain-containing protein n=2 Tax=Algivirga pacifica TaxID=1162670 RepID=A0ABP9DJ19_9BACT
MLIKSFLFIDLTTAFAIGGDFQYSDPIDYFTLFTHVLAHGDWDHLMSNMLYILLLGPILEEKYGSKAMFWMLVVTSLITGVIHLILYSHEMLVGASGIVFMLILLISVVNVQRGQIPISFLLIVVLFIGQELLRMMDDNNISELAHVIGGICGAFFGFRLLKTSKR